MIPTTRKNVLKVFGVIAVVLLFYIFVYWPNSPLGEQLQNLKIAEQQADMLREKFKNDPRFQQIRFVAFTGYNGCLEIGGVAATEQDIYFITNIIETVKCPVGVYYSLVTSNELVMFNWFDGNDEAPRIVKMLPTN